MRDVAVLLGLSPVVLGLLVVGFFWLIKCINVITEYERAVVEIRSRLGDAEIERLRQSGREMQLEQVLALAFSKTPAGVDSV